MKYLIFMLFCSCANANQGYVKVSTRSGDCQKSFTEDLTPDSFQVVYFCGDEGNVVIEVNDKALTKEKR